MNILPRHMLPVLLSVLLGAAGCSLSLGDPVGNFMDSAGSAAGETVGQAVGDAIVRRYTPALQQWYLSYMTHLAFGSGGYTVTPEGAEYEPGEFTRYRITGDDEELQGEMQRALLYVDREGNEAWQVIFHDTQAQESTIIEALFADDRRELKRMRAKFPDDEQAQEVPVEDGSYYQPPRRLTAESIEGATVGRESIEVPAGTFETRHVRYGQSSQGATLEWWLTEEGGAVPGGVVRYAQRHRDGSGDKPEDAEGLSRDLYVMELLEHGGGAESELGLSE